MVEPGPPVCYLPGMVSLIAGFLGGMGLFFAGLKRTGKGVRRLALARRRMLAALEDADPAPTCPPMRPPMRENAQPDSP